MKEIFCVLVFLYSLAVYDAVEVTDERFYPRYHLAPPAGWMNDPNGFCHFNGVYHMFYQYNPLSSLEPGIAHWGHAISPDLTNWKHLPIAMNPDQPYDKEGVFSGSALIEDETMYLYYTGNIKSSNQNPDQAQRQALATSTDGVNVTKYDRNPIIYGKDHQPNFRDPKVWKHNGSFFMVLGNSFDNDTRGRVLLYKSDDKINWEQVSVLDESDGSLGYMWECPDFFELNGKYVLLFSPQGIEPQGDKYRNLYQCGYIVGEFNYEDYTFKPVSEFKELDHGHDFYATQTTLDQQGQRVVMAWNDMWEENYPEGQDGFTGQMTIPRTLTIDGNNNLIQTPIVNLLSLRKRCLYSGNGRSGKVVQLEDKAGEINIRSAASKDLQVIFESEGQTVTLAYDALNGTVTLDRGGSDGVRRTQWRPTGQWLLWKIWVDASSVELFCGGGEITFSSRFFPTSDIAMRLGTQANSVKVYSINRSVPPPGQDQNCD